MKATICQLHDTPAALLADWAALVEHVRAKSSDLVLLPELPFYRWFPSTEHVDQDTIKEAVAAHLTWTQRLAELAPATVLATRPARDGGHLLNQGFCWDAENGLRPAHIKRYLPDMPGWREATWFSPGPDDFAAIDCGPARVGFMICTEIWFMEHARAYGAQGAHLVVTPRRTSPNSLDKWLAAGRTAAIVAGAYGLSSNTISPVDAEVSFGGQGWIVSPDGDVLATTSREQPFVTLELDLANADVAKGTYPRNVTIP